jgi:hypothetical protein
MKSNLGLAGQVSLLFLSFSTQQVTIHDPSEANEAQKFLIADEKDLAKLKLSQIGRCIAIPVLDKKHGISQAVIQIYNVDEEHFTNA